MSKLAALALAVDKPQRVEIRNPITHQPMTDKAGSTAYIEVYSADSEPARKAERAAIDRRLAVRGRTKVTAAEIEAERIGYLAAITTGWHLVDFQGQPIDVEFSAETAKELYSSGEFAWIRDQVDEFVGDRANFMKPSSKS